MQLLVLLLLVLLLVGGLPTWQYSANWGYGPSGVIFVIVVVLIVLALLGKL